MNRARPAFRPRPRVGALIGAAVACALASSCASTSHLLRARFAKEHACPESRVSVTEAGGTTYVATGCNVTVEYVCSSFAGEPGTEYKNCAERGASVGADKSPEQPRLVRPVVGPSTFPAPK